MIRVIIFDLWGTIGSKRFSIHRALFSRFGIPNTRRNLHRYEASIQLNTWKTLTGAAGGFLSFFRIPASPDNTAFVEHALKKAMSQNKPYAGMAGLIQRLHRRYKVAILSNTTVFESRLPRQWGLSRHLDAEVYSWRIRSLKPNPNNFRAVCRALKVAPRECVFIDDTKENVMAARRLGMKAILFRGIPDLKRNLQAIL